MHVEELDGNKNRLFMMSVQVFVKARIGCKERIKNKDDKLKNVETCSVALCVGLTSLFRIRPHHFTHVFANFFDLVCVVLLHVLVK